MSTPLSVVIVGARTVRQGTGPWFARHFAAEGAEVKGVLGRSRESADQAQEDLAERFGLAVAAHSSWEDLVDHCHPDLVAIATPAHTHREYLWKSLEAGVPAFVEKPFIWDGSRDNVKDAKELVAAFEYQQIPLYVCTQWPETLTTFSELYPDCDMQRIESLEMTLSPTSGGVEMVVDALPHAWNMLCSLAGEGQLHTLEKTSSAEDELQIEGQYRGTNGITRFAFTLKQCPNQPRPFSYSINGCRVDRQVDLTDYSMSFAAGDRMAPLKDPLAARISRVINLVSQKTYNSGLRQQVLETQLLQQSIEVAKA